MHRHRKDEEQKEERGQVKKASEGSAKAEYKYKSEEGHRYERHYDSEKYKERYGYEKKRENERHRRSHEDDKFDYKKSRDDKHPGKHKYEDDSKGGEKKHKEKSEEKHKQKEKEPASEKEDEDSESVWNEALLPNRQKRKRAEGVTRKEEVKGTLGLVKKYMEENDRLMGLKGCVSISQVEAISDVPEKPSMVLQKDGRKIIDTKAMKGEAESPSVQKSNREDLRAKIAELQAPIKGKQLVANKAIE